VNPRRDWLDLRQKVELNLDGVTFGEKFSAPITHGIDIVGM